MKLRLRLLQLELCDDNKEEMRMEKNSLLNLSPLDGRYHEDTEELDKYFSEFALMKARLEVMVKWLKKMLNITGDHAGLYNIVLLFDLNEAEIVKSIEDRTDHDVKAIEIYLAQKIKQMGQEHWQRQIKIEMIHFGCTSDDVDNLAYALLIKRSQREVLLPLWLEIITKLRNMAHDYAGYVMLGCTHGQTATPTTFGKEMAVFVDRLRDQNELLLLSRNNGKFNGATGNWNAVALASPDTGWLRTSEDFVRSFGLDYKRVTTQIEPHDGMVFKFDIMRHFNNILVDLCRDMWSYISIGYLNQKLNPDGVGSSTMPHKVNPIKFENAEGNLGFANSAFYHFSEVFTKSRMQRDLTTSTVLRHIGEAFGCSILAYKNLLKGLNKVEVNRDLMEKDLDEHWEVLTEAIQTVMRFHGTENAYDIVKEYSRGKKLNKEDIHHLIASIDIPGSEKERLMKLTPATYAGYASRIALEC